MKAESRVILSFCIFRYFHNILCVCVFFFLITLAAMLRMACGRRVKARKPIQKERGEMLVS